MRVLVDTGIAAETRYIATPVTWQMTQTAGQACAIQHVDFSTKILAELPTYL